MTEQIRREVESWSACGDGEANDEVIKARQKVKEVFGLSGFQNFEFHGCFQSFWLSWVDRNFKGDELVFLLFFAILGWDNFKWSVGGGHGGIRGWNLDKSWEDFEGGNRWEEFEERNSSRRTGSNVTVPYGEC